MERHRADIPTRTQAAQFGRNVGIGIGMFRLVAPTPTPPSQVLGGYVQPVPFPWHPAAQNMYPSIPFVVFGKTVGIVSTKFAAVSSSELP
jgi:hypothetical protein